MLRALDKEFAELPERWQDWTPRQFLVALAHAHKDVRNGFVPRIILNKGNGTWGSVPRDAWRNVNRNSAPPKFRNKALATKFHALSLQAAVAHAEAERNGTSIDNVARRMVDAKVKRIHDIAQMSRADPDSALHFFWMYKTIPALRDPKSPILEDATISAAVSEVHRIVQQPRPVPTAPGQNAVARNSGANRTRGANSIERASAALNSAGAGRGAGTVTSQKAGNGANSQRQAKLARGNSLVAFGAGGNANRNEPRARASADAKKGNGATVQKGTKNATRANGNGASPAAPAQPRRGSNTGNANAKTEYINAVRDDLETHSTAAERAGNGSTARNARNARNARAANTSPANGASANGASANALARRVALYRAVHAELFGKAHTNANTGNDEFRFLSRVDATSACQGGGVLRFSYKGRVSTVSIGERLGSSVREGFLNTESGRVRVLVRKLPLRAEEPLARMHQFALDALRGRVPFFPLVYAAGRCEAKTAYYVLSEAFERDLKHWGKRQPSDIAAGLAQVLVALAVAHSHGLAHGNVSESSVVVLDFARRDPGWWHFRAGDHGFCVRKNRGMFALAGLSAPRSKTPACETLDAIGMFVKHTDDEPVRAALRQLGTMAKRHAMDAAVLLSTPAALDLLAAVSGLAVKRETPRVDAPLVAPPGHRSRGGCARRSLSLRSLRNLPDPGNPIDAFRRARRSLGLR